ncbi:hypothetical protein CHCC20441_4247 [Bacillus licheniformis]|nr:hypothetical protein CHCC5026_0003 [Bacillus licheniformis]TWJ96569.1 hypothetical protein CHCC20493_1203 [Bacillus licheniformis]TWK06674.1 hypothetical protein CHCC20441_4247 [Bacillus licheniformis]TWK17523.1 hypothetical protein CHCC20440_2703 [Bacillus licheniformis]TWK63441.1 hypothetical protein CHCC20343_1526 [Bacillus licheniformis]
MIDEQLESLGIELELSEMIAGQLKAYFQNGKGVKGNESYI